MDCYFIHRRADFADYFLRYWVNYGLTFRHFVYSLTFNLQFYVDFPAAVCYIYGVGMLKYIRRGERSDCSECRGTFVPVDTLWLIHSLRSFRFLTWNLIVFENTPLYIQLTAFSMWNTFCSVYFHCSQKIHFLSRWNFSLYLYNCWLFYDLTTIIFNFL